MSHVKEHNDNSYMPTSTMGLVYIIGTYPLLTTTFIDREIRTLRRWGVDVQVVAIRRPPAGTPLSTDQKELQQGVTYLLPVSLPVLLASHLLFALSRPRSYFQTLAYLLTRSHSSHRARLKTLLHFGEGVYAAHLMRRRRFRELHAHFLDRAATVALVAGRLLGKPYSLSIHAGADIFANPVMIREKIAEARHAVTCTLYNKSHLEGIVGRHLVDKISYVHHGLDLANYLPQGPNGNGIPLILSVGQLAERKGFAHLIRACRSLKDQAYDLRCEIVGCGPQLQQLQALIRELDLEETVTLSGALPHDGVIEKYRQATIFVLPCTKSRDGNIDGIPNVLAEAMAMQLPVISTDVSAIPELITDKLNGLLVPAEDVDGLVDAMALLLRDPALRQRVGESGRRSVLDTFDVERNVRLFASTLWPEWFN